MGAERRTPQAVRSNRQAQEASSSVELATTAANGDKLTLVPHTAESLRALFASEEAYQQHTGLRLAEGLRGFFKSDEVSPEYIARIQTMTSSDPWTLGFAVVLESEKLVVGAGGYKGPPTNGCVEIAYGIARPYQGRGYATAVAMVLTQHALQTGVQIVRAHTLPERNASGRVLTKCGFKLIGEVIDPDDGPLWRWERSSGA